MLSDQELAQVQEMSAALTLPVHLTITHGYDDSTFGNNIANIARQISGVSMGAVPLTEELPTDGQYTRLSFGPADRPHIIFMAAPEGRLLGPFLKILGRIGGAETFPVPFDQDAVDHIPDGSEILAFIASGCPHCPAAISQLAALAIAQPKITLTVADALYVVDLAERYRVRATPTIIINGEATMVGQVKVADMVCFLSESAAPESMARILSSMIQSGRAEDAAEVICTKKCPEAALEVFLAPEFSIRLGALLAMEEALERDPRCLDPIVGKLVEQLASGDPPLRGDTAALLGKIGDARAIPGLQAACEDPDEDVADAAQEALEMIEER